MMSHLDGGSETLVSAFTHTFYFFVAIPILFQHFPFLDDGGLRLFLSMNFTLYSIRETCFIENCKGI